MNSVLFPGPCTTRDGQLFTITLSSKSDEFFSHSCVLTIHSHLDAGAPGLSLHFARRLAQENCSIIARVGVEPVDVNRLLGCPEFEEKNSKKKDVMEY